MHSTMFFVKTDLLLQENGFELLSEFVELFSQSSVFFAQYSELNLHNTSLKLTGPTADFNDFSALNSAIFKKINEGYILTNLVELKRLLSCNK